jgi:hypothetical protein
MGMLQSYSYPVIPLPPYHVFYDTPLTPLSRYPGLYPTPIPQYPGTPKDSLCESL